MFALGLSVSVGVLSASAAQTVVLDENVDDVLAIIANGEGTPEKVADAYSGSEALFVGSTGGDGQRYNDHFPDYGFNVVESPSGANEIRYITFAWKKDGGDGFQLQIHGEPDTWGHRYHAGANVKDWNPSIQASDTVPTTWTSVTRDLFDDWGAFTLTGFAFSAWDGVGGYWDQVVLHQSMDDAPTPVEPHDKLTTTWSELKK
jgi:hypothetical protein